LGLSVGSTKAVASYPMPVTEAAPAIVGTRLEEGAIADAVAADRPLGESPVVPKTTPSTGCSQGQ
jgi:hypothetical protein